MSEVSEYIAISIAAGRVEKARAKMRDRLLQQVELEGGRIIEDDEGVLFEIEDCPACEGGKVGAEGTIEVPAPFGLEARERTTYEVDIRGMPDEVLLWALRNRVYKVSLATNVFDVYSEDPSPESLYNMGVIGSQAHMRRVVTPTLNVLDAQKLKEELR